MRTLNAPAASQSCFFCLFVCSFVPFSDNPGSDLVPHHCGHQLQGAEEDPGPVPPGDLRQPGRSRVQAARLWLQRRVFTRGTVLRSEDCSLHSHSALSCRICLRKKKKIETNASRNNLTPPSSRFRFPPASLRHVTTLLRSCLSAFRRRLKTKENVNTSRLKSVSPVNPKGAGSRVRFSCCRFLKMRPRRPSTRRHPSAVVFADGRHRGLRPSGQLQGHGHGRRHWSH